MQSIPGLVTKFPEDMNPTVLVIQALAVLERYGLVEVQVDDSLLGGLSRSQLIKIAELEEFGLDMHNPNCLYLYDTDNAQSVSI